ncbi:MAG: M48 family metallopeptidase [Deltaproteobacteria bacterium]|nr:MAG: M48 family metallopeptidase [Deltaproteobacteria bacterium]
MANQFNLGNIPVDIQFKDIKNLHLSVCPPKGHVRISAPNRMKIERVRIYAVSKLDWIKKQQMKFINQERETQKEYIDRESHYVWGRRYLLKLEKSAAPEIILKHSQLVMRAHEAATTQRRKEYLEEWYRKILKAEAEYLIGKWENRLGLKVKQVFIQKMKTKWGSCNPRSKNIRLNTELAKKPKEFLDYIILHELSHLIEAKHNDQFIKIMDKHMLKWRFFKNELNALPVSFMDQKSCSNIKYHNKKP